MLPISIPDECILLSVLATVDLDHQAFLGTTVAAIAKEKAAIARRGKPFVLGCQVHDEVEEVAREAVTSIDGNFLRCTSSVCSSVECVCRWTRATFIFNFAGVAFASSLACPGLSSFPIARHYYLSTSSR